MKIGTFLLNTFELKHTFCREGMKNEEYIQQFFLFCSAEAANLKLKKKVVVLLPSRTGESLSTKTFYFEDLEVQVVNMVFIPQMMKSFIII